MNTNVTPLLMTRDTSGAVAYGLVASTEGYATLLSAGVAQEFTTPSGATRYLAVIGKTDGSSVYFAVNDTATSPSSSVASTASMLNPPSLQVNAGDTISALTTDATAAVNIRFYGLE